MNKLVIIVISLLIHSISYAEQLISVEEVNRYQGSVSPLASEKIIADPDAPNIVFLT